MYREKLHGLAFKAMKQHGTKIHLDSHFGGEASSPSPVNKEVDFFKEHVEDNMGEGLGNFSAPAVSNGASTASSVPVSIANGALSQPAPVVDDDGAEGPNVDVALSMSPTTALQVAEPRKATIGQRKPGAAKKGLGGKKGFGAQKVRTNFSDLESEAQQRDKDREQLEKMHAQQKVASKEDEAKRMVSMKLAYQDLSLEEKKREDKMKTADPKKKAQMERLGMGFGGSRGASHSVMSDMQTIDQETPTTLTSSGSQGRFNNYDDDFEVIGSFSSGPPK